MNLNVLTNDIALAVSAAGWHTYKTVTQSNRFPFCTIELENIEYETGFRGQARVTVGVSMFASAADLAASQELVHEALSSESAASIIQAIRDYNRFSGIAKARFINADSFGTIQLNEEPFAYMATLHLEITTTGDSKK